MATTPTPPSPPKLPVAGTFAKPPAHAPHETTQPLSPGLLQDQMAKAAANEKELQPLKFALTKAIAAAAGAPDVPPFAGDVSPVSAIPSDAPAGAPPVMPNPESAPAGAAALPAPGLPDGTAPLGEMTKTHQPAASNTDSPSRGVPKPILDPGKQITGGWGHGAMGAPQYFALDGSELRTLVQTLWKDIAARMEIDLRFMLAVTYPRVLARITVEVCGATPDAAINDVAFTLESRVLALTAQAMDDQDTPPDALRDQAGLAKPFKHLVQTSQGQLIVDTDVDLSTP